MAWARKEHRYLTGKRYQLVFFFFFLFSARQSSSGVFLFLWYSLLPCHRPIHVPLEEEQGEGVGLKSGGQGHKWSITDSDIFKSMSSFGTDENPKFYFFKKNPKFLHEPACSANPKADKIRWCYAGTALLLYNHCRSCSATIVVCTTWCCNVTEWL